MQEEIELCLEDAEDGMKSAISHLEKEFQKIRAGKASPSMLDGVIVDYYGVPTPIAQTANINTPDPRQIIVQPWDKSLLPALDKAIQAANLGFNPTNEGEVLRINVPPVTEERRRGLVKQAKTEVENCKVSIRNVRRLANDFAKALEKDGLPEDDSKKLQDDVQELTNKYSMIVDKLIAVKEEDVMKV